MAYLQIQHVSLKGISAAVPKTRESNWEYPYLPKEAAEAFINTTGVEYRRIAPKELCTSDLCVKAAEELISKLSWDRETIDVIIFVTQTPDYLLPITSAIIQDRLKLSKECLAIDIPLGCSGFVYGMSVICSLLQTGHLKRGLLLVGDTLSKSISHLDKSCHPLFGDAGAVAAFEYTADASPMHFHLGSDGSGYKAIIIPDGGSRSPVVSESLVMEEIADGISRNRCQLVLDGMDVFSFGISQAPKTVNALLQHFSLDSNAIDYFIFHQANLKMNKMIAKKLKLPENKVPYSLKDFGNTSSVTIPLTILDQLNEQKNKVTNWLFCGFGVGLSWGSVALTTDSLVTTDIIEL